MLHHDATHGPLVKQQAAQRGGGSGFYLDTCATHNLCCDPGLFQRGTLCALNVSDIVIVRDLANAGVIHARSGPQQFEPISQQRCRA